MSKRIAVPGVARGYAFIGCYQTGALGWHAPRFLSPHPNRREVAKAYGRDVMRKFADERFYLCGVTITPILDKCGRPITRKARTLRIVEES
jgi:hypothetical protein